MTKENKSAKEKQLETALKINQRSIFQKILKAQQGHGLAMTKSLTVTRKKSAPGLLNEVNSCFDAIGGSATHHATGQASHLAAVS